MDLPRGVGGFQDRSSERSARRCESLGVRLIESIVARMGGEPPGESVADLGDFKLLAVDVVFDFGNGWKDVEL